MTVKLLTFSLFNSRNNLSAFDHERHQILWRRSRPSTMHWYQPELLAWFQQLWKRVKLKQLHDIAHKRHFINIIEFAVSRTICLWINFYFYIALFFVFVNINWPETTINYTMIYYIATVAIILWSVSLGYWNLTEIITCLGPLNTQKDNPCWPATFFTICM